MTADTQGQNPEGASNVLVIDGSDTSHWLIENYDSITAEDTRIANLLSITVSESAQLHYETLQRHLDRPSPRIGIITVNEQTRSTATPISSSPLLDSNDVWITNVSNFDLSKLGINIHTYLHERIEDTSKVALLVPSLSELLQQTDLELTFRFLHILTGKITASDAVGYYQIDGNHEPQTIATLAPLFDAVIKVTDDDRYPVQHPVTDSKQHHAEIKPVSEETGSTKPYVGRLSEFTPWLWLVAIALFGFGDIFTTFIGLQTGIAVEASPVAAQVVNANGLGFIYVVKLTMFGLFYLLWRVTPPPHRVGVPLGLSLVGASVTVWNLGILIMTSSAP